MAVWARVPVGLSVALAAAMVPGPQVAEAQTVVPDAQVEANVLRALAGAPELADEAITTQTVYGTVTLSGSVLNESRRRQAETLVAASVGVKKVIDELRLSESATDTVQSAAAQGPSPLVLQSDGTYLPAQAAPGAPAGTTVVPAPAPGSAPAASAQRNNPDADQALDQQADQPRTAQFPVGATRSEQPAAPQQPAVPQFPAAPQYPVAPQQPTSAQTPQQPGYPSSGYPNYPGYPGGGRRPMYTPGQSTYPASPGAYPGPYGGSQYGQPGSPVEGGQAGGQAVMIPTGTMIRVRLNRTLSSDRTPAGTPFDGVVVNDVVAGNHIAIPRGAAVQGTVIEATRSGTLKGRGEMAIQLSQVTLGGRSYALVSDVFGTHGRDKTIETVNKTAGFGAVGAVIGALAGGGVGAAVGGGIGAAAGLGSSAASGDGQGFIPAEALITFHTAQPATVTTVSEQEMQRLAYGVATGAERPGQYRRAPRVYVGPGYYSGYYPYRPVYEPYGYPVY